MHIGGMYIKWMDGRRARRMQSDLDLLYITTKSYAKIQLNISKHLGEKCGKLHISYILSSQRGIAPSKIDAK